MKKVVITTKKCPCCKYTYQTSDSYVTVGKLEKKVIKKGEKPLKGTKDFKSIIVRTGLFRISNIGMECPECGVHMSNNKCIAKEIII